MNTSIFTEYILPAVLFIIMFGMGMSLQTKDFRILFTRPKIIFVGLVAQMFVIPIVAFIIGFIAPIDPLMKVGLVLIAAAPGGTASNLVTLWLRGNIALCMALTAITSVLILITLPIVVKIALFTFVGASNDIQLPLGISIINIFLFTLLPAFLGMLLRYYKEIWTLRIEKFMEYLMSFLLLGVFILIIFFEQKSSSGGTTLKVYFYIFIVTFALNALSIYIGYLFARSLGSSTRDNFTIALQVGFQNSALAIFVAETIIHSRPMAVVALVYGSFTFFTTWIGGWIIKRYG